MADDTLTVAQAKQRLLDLTPAALWEDWLPALDALIAAVRAEQTAPKRHATDCKIHFAEGGYEPCTCGLNRS